MGPLEGVRVLDLTRVLAGPLAGQILADLGCDVVKVERPGEGDDTRGWGPPFARDAAGRETGESAYFQSVNRGKRSVSIDLAVPEGAALVRRLAGVADVLIQNFRPGVLARHGLDHATLAAAHPRLVYCSISGFGQTGPRAREPGYDPIAQALGGMMSVTGPAPGADGDSEPVRCGVAVIDVLTGVYTALAVSAALHHRRDTGLGQHIDIGLLDVQLASLVNIAQSYLSAGVVGGRMGSAHPSVVPSQVFRATDGWMMVSAANDLQFRRLCEAAGRPELPADARFATNEARVRHRDVVVPVIAAIFAGRAVAEWVAVLNGAGVSCAPINDVAQAFAEPQVRARGTRIELPDPDLGTVAMVASPLRFSASPVEYHRPPPRLGAHTGEVLRDWLALEEEEIAALRGGAIP